MLQQCKLRVVGSEQKGTCRMCLGAKIKRVKWKDSLIEGAIEVAYLNAVVSHLRRDNIPFITCVVLLHGNVGECSDGTTAGSKEISVLRLAVQVPYSQRDNSSLFVIKRFDHRMDARLNACAPLSSSSDFAFKWLYHITALWECCHREAH